MTSPVRRWIAVWLVALTLALLWKYHDSTTPAATVAACTYSLEHTNSATKSFYSVYFQATDTLHVEVATYDGTVGVGCAYYKEYKVSQWTTLGTPGSYFSEVRVWVCGTYYGAWTANSATVWSQSFDYGVCGRQADDNGSYFHDSHGGENVSVYVNQG